MIRSSREMIVIGNTQTHTQTHTPITTCISLPCFAARDDNSVCVCGGTRLHSRFSKQRVTCRGECVLVGYAWIRQILMEKLIQCTVVTRLLNANSSCHYLIDSCQYWHDPYIISTRFAQSNDMLPLPLSSLCVCYECAGCTVASHVVQYCLHWSLGSPVNPALLMLVFRVYIIILSVFQA